MFFTFFKLRKWYQIAQRILSSSAGNLEPVGTKRICERSLQKIKYDTLHFMVMVTVKAFQLLKIHIYPCIHIYP